ncbi:DNA-binding protein, partial [Arthrobacter sp. H14]|uniref:DNA-binding protein n=1 Tax=Arthrobacter sp. H14 TaxID=1312959 RepID=UPI00056794DC
MAESSKERVYAAAARIGADRVPTVTAVREAAGVSMADASRYLRQWKEDAVAATAAVVAAPGALTDQAQKLAGTIWAEAVRLAGEDHRAAQAAWEAEKKALGQEIDELVTAADSAEAQHRTAL